MKDELVGFELALLAKTKGYQRFKDNEEVSGEFFWYDSNRELNTGYYLNGSGSTFGARMNDPKKGAIYSNSCEAPTQSLLQRWLREVHNIHIKISYTGKYFMKYKKGYGSTYIRSHALQNNKTHEEALEFGLKTGLEMLI